MGCDIHAHLEAKINGEWLYYSPVAINRSYELFANMADCGRMTDITPLAPNRGIPTNATLMTLNHVEYWGVDGHSHSWLNEQEIQELGQIYARISGEKWAHGYLGNNRVYLFGNCVDKRNQYPEDYEHMAWLEDIRLIFWFDN